MRLVNKQYIRWQALIRLLKAFDVRDTSIIVKERYSPYGTFVYADIKVWCP